MQQGLEREREAGRKGEEGEKSRKEGEKKGRRRIDVDGE